MKSTWRAVPALLIVLILGSLSACGGIPASISPAAEPSPASQKSFTGTWSSQQPVYGLIFGTIPGGRAASPGGRVASPEESRKDPWATWGSVYDGDVTLILVQSGNRLDGVVRLHNIRARPDDDVKYIQNSLFDREKEIREVQERILTLEKGFSILEAKRALADAQGIPENERPPEISIEWINPMRQDIAFQRERLTTLQKQYDDSLATIERLSRRHPPFRDFEWPITRGKVGKSHFSFEAGSWKWEGEITPEGAEMWGTVKYSGTPGGMPSDSSGEFRLKRKDTAIVRGEVHSKPSRFHDLEPLILGVNDNLENARVTISGPVSRMVEVDKEGAYLFADLLAGSYQVTASARWYLSETRTVELASGQEVELDFFVLMRGKGIIQGKVMREGKGVAKMPVRAIIIPSDLILAATYSEADGSYSMGVPAGWYLVSAKGMTDEQGSSFVVEPDATVIHDVILQP